MRNKAGFTSPNGFTLVEILVALTAMGIAFVALWGLHFSSLSVDTRNRHEAEALAWANDQIEQMRSMPLPLQDGNDQIVDAKNMVYQRQWTVTRPRPWQYDVSVVVTWTEPVKSLGGTRTDVQRSVELVTTIADLS